MLRRLSSLLRRSTAASTAMLERDTALLRLQHVSKTYQTGELAVEVLRDVSLTVQAGEFLVIVGPSGSGKTTLLNLAGGLDQPTSGAVRFQGRDLAGVTRAELTEYRRGHVGFVFQFYNLIPTLTAWENVQVGAELSEQALDCTAMLDRVGLGHHLDHFPAQLSGGEQQRVALARALAKNPDLLLCDEPTGALDDTTGRQVLAVLRDVTRELGKTVLFITHNQAIGHMADRVVRMRSGRIVEIEDNPIPLAPEEIDW